MINRPPMRKEAKGSLQIEVPLRLKMAIMLLFQEIVQKLIKDQFPVSNQLSHKNQKLNRKHVILIKNLQVTNRLKETHTNPDKQ